MILVTLGTQKEPFKRLLDYVENSNIKDEIIVQAGHTKYESKKMKMFDFVSYEEMQKYIDKADLVITHGGTGSILMPLKTGKRVLAVPRLKKYMEHVDDHQTQIVDLFSEIGYIVAFRDGDDFNKAYQKALKLKPKKYVSNTEHFIEELKKEIDM